MESSSGRGSSRSRSRAPAPPGGLGNASISVSTPRTVSARPTNSTTGASAAQCARRLDDGAPEPNRSSGTSRRPDNLLSTRGSGESTADTGLAQGAGGHPSRQRRGRQHPRAQHVGVDGGPPTRLLESADVGQLGPRVDGGHRAVPAQGECRRPAAAPAPRRARGPDRGADRPARPRTPRRDRQGTSPSAHRVRPPRRSRRRDHARGRR